jgi:hypothetical protein
VAGVVFRRIHGRIVPIRQKQSQAPSVAQVAKATAAVAAGALTYRHLRAFSPSATPALRLLQKKINNGGLSSLFSRKYSPLGKLSDAALSFAYGSPVNKKGTKVVIASYGKRPNSWKHRINGPNVTSMLGDKFNFSRHMPKHSIPKTMRLDEALNKTGGSARGLKRLFGKDGYVIKKIASSNTKLSMFPNEKTFKVSNPKMAAIAKKADKYIIQQRLKVNGEFRVHFVNGEPFAIHHRWDKGIGKLNPFNSPVLDQKKVEALKKFTKENFPKLPGVKMGRNQSVMGAFDIAETEKGFKFLEANTRPQTHWDPFISRAFHRQLHGRWGRDVAAGAGAGVTAGAYAILPGGKIKKRGKK